MKVLKVLTTLFFILLGSIFFSVQIEGNASQKTSITSERVKLSSASAKEIYRQNCARCHGADGRGDTELGRTYDTPDISAAKMKKKGSAGLARKISRGGGGMPAFGKKLKAKEITDLVSYLRTLN